MISRTIERMRRAILHEIDHDSFERERLKTDQITEASERLNGAMENVFEYQYQNGDLYFQGQALRPIFERGIANSEEIVKTKPQFAVELVRRHIELKQLENQVQLIKNVDWQDPLMLVHISPTPDAVLNDDLDLEAYDKQRKKIMVRISEPTIDGLKVTSLSLDGGDRLALQAVADFFGVDIPDDASSEDILNMDFIALKSQFKGERPAKVLRERYDKAMQMQYGGDWHAGRRGGEVQTTMQKIMQYPKLVEQHVSEIWKLKKRAGMNFRFTSEYDKLTYNFLAAIEQSVASGTAVKSIASAGLRARANGKQYAKPDCPTSSISSAEQALQQQGIGKEGYVVEKKWMGCPDCGKKNACYGDPCAHRLDCQFCGAYVEGGVMHKGNKRTMVKEAYNPDSKKNPTTEKAHKLLEQKVLLASVKRRFGVRAIIRSRIAVGGTKNRVVNDLTGQVLADTV